MLQRVPGQEVGRLRALHHWKCCDTLTRTAAHQRSIGQANLPNMRDLIRSLAIYPVTRRHLRSAEDFQALIDRACEELGNIEAKPYIRLYPATISPGEDATQLTLPIVRPVSGESNELLEEVVVIP